MKNIGRIYGIAITGMPCATLLLCLRVFGWKSLDYHELNLALLVIVLITLIAMIYFPIGYYSLSLFSIITIAYVLVMIVSADHPQGTFGAAIATVVATIYIVAPIYIIWFLVKLTSALRKGNSEKPQPNKAL